jgi:hypothetical protein
MACYMAASLLGHENGMAAFAMSVKQVFRASQRVAEPDTTKTVTDGRDVSLRN